MNNGVCFQEKLICLSRWRLFFAIIWAGYGGIFPTFALAYPVELRAVDVSKVGNTGAYVYVSHWDLGDGGPNPMYGYGLDDDIYFVYKNSFTGGQDEMPYPMHVPGARKAKTMGELGALVEAAGYIGRGSTVYNRRSGRDVCWRLGHTSRLLPGYVFTFEGMPCQKSELAPDACWISDSFLEINHGVLSPSAVNGNSASTYFSVTCSSSLPVKVISPSGVNSIALSTTDGLRSDITVNGSSLGEGYALRASEIPTTVTITSTLGGFNSQSVGDFSGAFTIIISPN
ncbi:hypothetical protein GKN89_20885 [Serratia sp. YC16]|uniref:MrpH family fimbial adhesin n=1 Tax=Serratia sp. YC16 TaxID=2675312 RepID=UPI0012B7355C|nr:hypothetical protein [Serratia sp. YC16]MTD09183.1 hypothetical protein [Serratia sp. YC16]